MADRTILNPQYANDLNGLFNGSGTIDTGNITASTILLNGGGSYINIGQSGDPGDTTFDTDGTLTITRNVSGGNNEFDFVAINSTTPDGINFYVSQTEVVGSDVTPALLKITTAGTITSGSMTSNAGNGNIDIGAVGISGGETYDTDSTLTITRNVSGGNNEFDFVVINSTSSRGMSFYASETEVNNESIPSLSVTTVGTTTSGIMTSSNGNGNIDIGAAGISGGETYDTDSTLTITRNVSGGYNEFDFVTINSTSSRGMSFYTSDTEVNNESIPSLSVTTLGISAPTYTGGIGCVYLPISIPSLAILNSYTVNMTISNFIGSDSSVYVASLSNSSLASITSTIGVSYSGVSGTGTIVTVVITNPSSAPAGGFSVAYDAYVNIIAMNPV
jgi:ribosomal protein S28E/S33